jgi:hypothetical protein
LSVFLLKSLLARFDLLSVLVDLGLDLNLLSEFSLGVLIGFLCSLEVSLQLAILLDGLLPGLFELLEHLGGLGLFSSLGLDDLFLLSNEDLDLGGLLFDGSFLGGALAGELLLLGLESDDG